MINDSVDDHSKKNVSESDTKSDPLVDARTSDGNERKIIMRSQKCEQKKGANNEAHYEESSVTDEVPSYFNIFECGRNLLNRLDLTYE